MFGAISVVTAMPPSSIEFLNGLSILNFPRQPPSNEIAHLTSCSREAF